MVISNFRGFLLSQLPRGKKRHIPSFSFQFKGRERRGIYLRPYFTLTDGRRVGHVDVDVVEEVWRQTEAEDGVGQLEGVVRRLRELRRARLHLGEGLEHLPLRAVADRLPRQVRPVRHRDGVVGAVHVADTCDDNDRKLMSCSVVLP